MERKINKYVKKWLGVPSSFTNIAIHSSQTKLTIPVQFLVEVKVAKVGSFLILQDSKDPVIKNIQLDVRSGRKWSAWAAVDEAESRLKHKEMVRATQLGHQGLGWTTHKWWSSSTVTTFRIWKEIHLQEETYLVTVQTAWTAEEISIELQPLNLISIILNHSQSAEELLKRRKVLHEDILKYLNKQGFELSPLLDKQQLIDYALAYWSITETNGEPSTAETNLQFPHPKPMEELEEARRQEEQRRRREQIVNPPQRATAMKLDMHVNISQY
ncbi:uncharacterized protein [Hemitrygon akajei]|uniref:uncharacterized protein n=1 Tax=Hemitrygon akajei TaxID=2704970 RepID=UPI003BF95000